jgi:pentose-5-phosphate-3-epimerase
VNAETIGECAKAGAELLVAGVAVFHTDDYAATMDQLQEKARARSAASRS